MIGLPNVPGSLPPVYGAGKRPGKRHGGWAVTPLYVSAVKSNTKAKKKAGQAIASAAAPALPKDAVSIGALRKAKKLVAELGGIKQAKTAVDALAQLLD